MGLSESRSGDPVVVRVSETRVAGDYSLTRTAEVKVVTISAPDLLSVIDAVSGAVSQGEGEGD